MAIIQLTKSRYVGISKDIKPKDAAYGASFYEYDTERIYDRALDYIPNNGWKLRETSGGTGGGFSMEEIQAMISTFISTTGGIEHTYSDDSNSFLIFLNEDIKTKIDLIQISESIDLDGIKSDVETNNSKNSYPDSASNKINNLPANQNEVNTAQETINNDIEQRVSINDNKVSYPGPQDLSGKQDLLQNGANIKTVGGVNILGAGDIPIQGGSGTTNNYNTIFTDKGGDNLTGAMNGSNKIFTVSEGKYKPGSIVVDLNGKTSRSLSSVITETDPTNGIVTIDFSPDYEIESTDELFVTYQVSIINTNDTGQPDQSLSVVNNELRLTKNGQSDDTVDLSPYLGGGGSASVNSVNGETGVVVLDKDDIGLNNIDNTSDANKPISTATQTALNTKVDDTQVLTDVPAGAVFTDTIYDDTTIQAEVTNNTNKLAGIEVNAKDDQTGSEIEALLDTELGNTDWKTGGASSGQEELNIINVTEHGVSANTTDQRANIEALIANNTILYFPAGIYDTIAQIDIPAVTNFHMIANKNATIRTTAKIAIEFTGITTKCSIKGLKIESTNVEGVVGAGQYSMIYSNNTEIDNLLLKDLYITCSGVSSNGIKILNESTEFAKNIVIDNCDFVDIGRMALETQNHVPANEVERIVNFTIKNCRVKNTGLIEFGMGFSFSGLVKNLKVLDNNLEGCSNRALEFLATDTAIISGNYGKLNNAFSIFTENAAATLLPSKNIIFENNIIDGLGLGGTDNKDGIHFNDVENLTINNNITKGITGGFFLKKVKQGYLHNNIINVSAFGAFMTQDCEDITIVGGSLENTKSGNGLIRVTSNSINYRIIGTTLRNSTSQIPIRLDGASTLEPKLIECPRWNGVTFDTVLGEINKGPSITNTAVIELDNTEGQLNSMGAARNSGAYFVSGGASGGVPNGWSKTLINTGTEPTVDAGAVKIKGADFIANTDMYLVIQDNGNRIEYYFLEI